jgi:hypothetical protein
MRGNPRAHRSSAKNCDFINAFHAPASRKT